MIWTLTLLGCSQNQPVRTPTTDYETPVLPATNAEKAAALKQWELCMLHADSQLDDGVSGANTIAQGAEGYCEIQWHNVIASLVRGMPGLEAYYFAKDINNSGREQNLAVETVLMERKYKRTGYL